MGPLPLRAHLHRTRSRLAALLVVLLLAASVVVHHTEPMPMGGMHGEHAMATAAMCAGTIVGAVAIVGLVAAVRRAPRPRRRAQAAVWTTVARITPTGPVPRARAGPLYLQHAVLRR